MCGKGISAPADLFAIGIGLYDRVINLTSNDVTLSFQTNKTLRVVRHNAHVHRQAHMSQKCTRSFNIFCTKGAVEKCYLLSRLLSIPFYRPPFLLFHFSFPTPKLSYNYMFSSKRCLVPHESWMYIGHTMQIHHEKMHKSAFHLLTLSWRYSSTTFPNFRPSFPSIFNTHNFILIRESWSVYIFYQRLETHEKSCLMLWLICLLWEKQAISSQYWGMCKIWAYLCQIHARAKKI